MALPFSAALEIPIVRSSLNTRRRRNTRTVINENGIPPHQRVRVWTLAIQ